jgi:beta-glucanase (GH16 family)
MSENTSMGIIWLMALVAALNGCTKGTGTVDQGQTPADTLGLPGWTLVWHDEFEGNAVDSLKWSYEVNGDGGGNNELQYYTARPQNSLVTNGVLVIQAQQESYLGKSYTSARMRTLGKGDWKYGRFDVRAMLPAGKGLWPAIWMLPTDWVYGGWPVSGEIDIMELLGDNTRKVYGTIHYGSSVQNHQSTGSSYVLTAPADFDTQFHLFTLEWDSTGMRWFVDGAKYFTATHGAPFDQRFHLLLNVAVGGNWPGNPDATTSFPQAMQVDYVRVYRKSN